MPTIDDMLTRRPDDRVEALFHTVTVKRALEGLSNDEIGRLLLDHVWAEVSTLDPLSVLLSEAVDRLRR